MELFSEMLIKLLAAEEMHVVFPNLQLTIAEIVVHESYKALQEIKAIIEDDRLPGAILCAEGGDRLGVIWQRGRKFNICHTSLLLRQ